MTNHLSTSAPRIMLLVTSDWIFPAQIARAFSEAGCELSIVSVNFSPLRRTKYSLLTFNLPTFRPHFYLNQAMESWQPQLLVPCDDAAALLLHQMRSHASKEMLSVIERSQGSASGFFIASSKIRVTKLAEQIGVLVPRSRMMNSLTDLPDIGSYPYVIKRDCTYGGQGVTFATRYEEVVEALEQRPLRSFALIRRLAGIVKRKRYWEMRQLISRKAYEYLGQKPIHGRDANRLVFCSNGNVLAGISVEVEQTKSNHGPAALVRFSNNKQLSESSQLLVKELGLSGFYGFDFVIERGTEKAYLLEINPRATQICHLTNFHGVNLIREACKSLGFMPLQIMRPIRENNIALFPAGILNSSEASITQESCFFDIPWDDIDLVDGELAKDKTGELRRVVDMFRKARCSSDNELEVQSAHC